MGPCGVMKCLDDEDGKTLRGIAYRKSRGHFTVINKSVQKKRKFGSQVDTVIRNHGELNDKRE